MLSYFLPYFPFTSVIRQVIKPQKKTFLFFNLPPASNPRRSTQIKHYPFISAAAGRPATIPCP